MRPITLLFVLSFSYSIVSGQCTGDRYLKPITTQVDVTTMQYGQNKDFKDQVVPLMLDLYTPSGDVTTNRPLVILCFGGAFVTGSRKSLDIVYLAQELSKLGYVCAAIDYRLVDTTAFSDSSMMIRAVIMALQDAKASIRYLRSIATTIGIDTQRVFMGGVSAGGVLSLINAYSQFDEYSPMMQQLINQLGGYEGQSNSIVSYSSRVQAIFNLSGGMPDISHITPNEPPAYLNHCIDDPVVPYQYGPTLGGRVRSALYGSQPIYHRLTSLGIVAKFDSFIGSNHPSFVSSSGIDFTNLIKTTQNLIDFLYHNTCGIQSLISDLKTSNIALKYDPAANEYELLNLIKPLGYTICDMLGHRVESGIYHPNHKLNLNHLTSGSYILKLDFGHVFKLTVQ